MIRLLVAVVAAALVPPVFAVAADQDMASSDLAFTAWAKACAGNVGNSAGAEAASRSMGFLDAPAQVASALDPQGSGMVLLFPNPAIGVAVVYQKDGLGCRVLMQRGDTDGLRSKFLAVVEGIKRPGIELTEVPVETGIEGVHNRSFRLHVPGQPGADRLFSLTTNTQAGAAMQATLTAAAVAPGR